MIFINVECKESYHSSTQSCDGSNFGFGAPAIGRRNSDISLHCCHTDLCNVPAYATTTQDPTLTVSTLPPIQSKTY